MEHSLSKKSYRGGNGYAGKTATSVYDDVFGGPPKFGVPNLSPRLQDYNEIFEGFHASRGSSIPILDLPSVDDGFADYCFDVRSSRFDYSEVFGGFDAVDFAVSYEELFGRSKGGAGGGDDSSDDAWTPAQSESLSDESDPSASLERNQSLSNGDQDHSFGGIKQLKVSHNKASTKTEEDTLNAMGHISHFHAVPGFTAFTNETEPSKTIVGEKLPLQERSDLNPSMDFGGRVTQVKLVRKTKSHPSNAESARERYERNVNPLPGHEKQCSDGNRPQLSVSDFSLKTQPSQLPPPSRPPPALTVNKKEKDSGTPNSKLKASKSYAFEQTVGDTSPTYFDVEIDASSSAAVSAAAMKDAVEKAQAKLRSAKESMERKKEGLQGRFKVSNDDLNEREESLSKTNDKTSSFKNERMLGDFGDEDSRMRRHAKEAREKLKKTADSIEGQNQIPVTGDSVERKHGKECKSSPGSHETEENVALSEEAQFYQMLGENYVRDAKVLNQNTMSGEHEKKSRSTVEVFEQQEDGWNIIDTADSIEWEGNHNLSQVPNGTCQWDENTDRLLLHQTYHQKEHLKKANMDLQAGDLKEQGKKLRANQQLGEIEMILKEADESEECENLIEIQLKEDKVDFEEKVNGFSRRLASDKRFKDTNENQDQGQAQSFDSEYFIGIEEAALQAENERRPKKSVEEDAKEKQQKEGIEREEMEKTQKDHERGVEKHYQPEKNEKRFKKAFELEETEKQSKVIVEPEGEMHTNKEIVKESQKQEKNQFNLEEARALEENATKQQNIGGRVENVNIVTDACENEEDGKRPKTDWSPEERKKTLQEGLDGEKSRKVTFKEEGNEKKLKATVGEENVNIVTDACENEEDGKRPKTAWSPEESKKTLQEGLDGEKSRKVTFKEEGNEKKLKATVGEETENMVQDAGDMVNFKGQNGVHEKVDMEENDCRLTSDEDIGDGTEGKNMNGSDGAYVIDDIEVPHPIQVSLHDRDSDNLETTQEILSSNGYGKSRIDLRDCEREAEAVVVPVELSGKVRTKAEEAMDSCHLHHTESVSDKGGIGITKSNIENDKRASEMVSELLNTNSLAPNQVEGRKKTKEVQCTTDHKGSKDEFTCPQSQEQRDGEKIVDAPRVVFEGKRRNTNNPDPKGTSQRMGREDENRKTTLTPAEKEKQERLKREREHEKDRLRKIEEERERQREREKDMMSIDRATLEARERAFVENRERVERATVDRAAAEVRQRALAEARERLEKACAEARERTFSGKSSMERSFAEKGSMEARLRAERASVERAAAQARERAEKAAAEKAALEARERGERSDADKLLASSRSSGMRQNSSSSDLLDSNFLSMGPYSTSRYSHTSGHVGGETESPQRCKARLERHRRTAERAQKALAEKNMRDLLVQKEQAERNRLAEGLDAEVRRWCSGKEGNLRALLSTLQYILGPDSGWQPVPLTDVITTVAVKKTYRKATLCVHPDKLQQRGATIHQKYICEKVFDLLKEAWNKFNSEER